MAVFLAPLINDQQENSNGAPLSGGSIEVYLAGSSTPSTTYSDKAGLVPNTWPITLNTIGVNSQGSVWLTGGATYKFIIKDSTGVVQRSPDNIPGINDNSIAAADQWVVYQGTPTYISGTSFSVAGDQTQTLQVGRRLRTQNTSGLVYGTITASVYGAPNTTVTVANDASALDAGLSVVSYGIISPLNTSAPLITPTGGLGDRNLLVNGNFAINQRVYVSGVATTGASQGTLDRWRVVTSGQNITFGAATPDRTVTCPAGGLEQVIEAGWVAGGVYTLSWTGAATATVNGVAILTGAQTGVLPANTAATIKFSSGTVVNAQFELGAVATPYQRRPPGTEMALCQRDYAKSYALGVTPGTATTAGAVSMSSAVGGAIIGNFRFPVPMRSTATALNVWTTGGGANQFAAYTAGGAVTAYTATLVATESSMRVSVSIAAGEIWAEGQYIAATGF